ncbi:PAS domain S-box protein [sulfur-oxidizing endosymbiont of Gigantopelta aegis]|uniref:PAS domain S-box protein n=1 Tax=sulfur-oxidizing endosymbiont of Gigantopelta aegis TaxID=2794934 RepID=UPI0018DE9E88|nr:PAS domain S-box protein [sulfur-oxidizing endosymbiont of Gigantopelta aegis]
MKSNIAKKLILYTILFSSAITLIITAVQLYTEFQYDVMSINEKLQQIESSYDESITRSVWNLDKDQLQVILDGITELPDIIYAKVNTGDDTEIVSSRHASSEIIKSKLDLNYFYNNKNITIGSFTVIASLDDVYHRLLNRLWVILFSNALKTSLVAVFIFYLFSHLVTRHLGKISRFSEQHNALSEQKTLTLDRNTSQHDELDTVVEAINDMHYRLHEKISEINRQKQYLSRTLNSIGDAVITTDNKGLVTRLNPVAEKLTGWSNTDALNKPLKAIFPIIDATTRETIPNPVDTVLNRGETVYLSNHTTLIAQNGQEYQIADSAAPIRDGDTILGMVLVFNDVTEEYKMREALHESEQRLRQLAENLNEVFWLGSPDWNEIIYISPAYEKLWGMSADKLYQNPRVWLESIHPDDQAQILAEIPQQSDNIPACIEFSEYRIIKPDNSILWIKARAYPVYDSDGKAVRIAGIAEDITAKKAADETLRRTQKMNALGKLTGGIAHDYNNMLGVVLGYADLLNDMLEDQPKLQAYVSKITHAGQRGAKLTKKLLSFSKSKSTDIKKLDINTLLRDEQHMLEKTLTARIKLSLILEQNLWPVCLDESELEDAILNMAINAMHAIDKNGQLEITTLNVPASSIEKQGLLLAIGDYVQVSISDSGCGMSESVKEQIFDPFYSTKGEQGTGLGLSQVYGFVSRSGGTIEVHSKLELGSQFNLYFPRYTGEDTARNAAEKSTITRLKNEVIILVVDDEPDLLNLACEILSKHGYQIYRAEHAKQALSIMATTHIDILFSDIIMPDMDGYTLAAEVSKRYPNIKIQLSSGYSGEKNTEQVDNQLSQQVLQKPYTAQTLLKRIQDLLN